MKSSAAKNNLDISEKHFFENAIAYAHSNKYGIALWKNPNATERHVTIGNNVLFSTEDVDSNKSGFVFHPSQKETNGHLIENQFKAKYENQLSIEVDAISATDDIIQGKVSGLKDTFYFNKSVSPYCEDQNDFKQYVINGIEAIKSNQFQKVVPSRSKKVELPNNFDLVALFLNLCNKYPNAFVSLVSTPEAGTWIGATPEVLIEVKDSTFKTVALAGTQQYDGSASLSTISWTQKEIEEQALVSRYIINCFKKIRLREFAEIGPKTIVAGNLLHLKTTFEVDMKSTNFLQLGSVMLDLLHPTSAVCGMPQKEANDFILKHEGNNRHYFSGFLGPVNMNGTTSLFVNLRCMQLLENVAIIYAGAGLTEDSDPEKELIETEMKMNTLLKVMNQ